MYLSMADATPERNGLQPIEAVRLDAVPFSAQDVGAGEDELDILVARLPRLDYIAR